LKNVSTLQVERCSPLTIEDWSRFDARFGAPTFFARPAWALALASVSGDARPLPLSLAMSDGSSVIVPFLESRTRLFGMRTLTGMPLRTYTAFVGSDGTPAGPQATEAAVRYLLASGGDGVEIVPWPLGHLPAADEADPPMPTTSVIDLAPGFDACVAAMDGVARRMAGQARRRGVECRIESGDAAASTYYAMLAESAVRWGRNAPTISRDLLAATLRNAGADAEIWIARCDGQAIAGGIVVYGRLEAFFWTAAMRAEYGPLRPSNLLNVCMIEHAIQRGSRWFNLGGSEGLPGVKKFKDSLGARSIAYAVLRKSSARLRAYRRASGALRSLYARGGAKSVTGGEGLGVANPLSDSGVGEGVGFAAPE